MKLRNFVSWSLERISFPAKSHFQAEFPVSCALRFALYPLFSPVSVLLPSSVPLQTPIGIWASFDPNQYTHPPTNRIGMNCCCLHIIVMIMPSQLQLGLSWSLTISYCWILSQCLMYNKIQTMRLYVKANVLSISNCALLRLRMFWKSITNIS